MTSTGIRIDDIAALNVLASGIIPSDHRDGGAESLNAGSRIAERFRPATIGLLYAEGLSLAAKLAQEKFGKAVQELSPSEVAGFLGILVEEHPMFFRQLRADTCAVYLSDPAVLQRIGFPGPSAATGGYPNFDRPM